MKKEKEKWPNEGLGMEKLDYSKMDGSTDEQKNNFKEYQAIERKLLLNQSYDFEMWKATVEKKFRFNEDTGERTEYIAGIKIQSNKPVITTRISAKDAFTINNHVSKDHNTSKYYLLAQKEREVEHA